MPECPACHSSNTRRSRSRSSDKRHGNWFKTAYRCRDCGKRFLVPSFPLVTGWSNLLLFPLLLIPFAAVMFWASGKFQAAPVEVPLAVESPGWTDGAAPVVAEESGLAELRASAESGDQEAQYELATRLANRYGTSGDMAIRREALRWLQEAAGGGHRRAQTELATRFVEGRGVVQDFTQAASWYRKAARQGDPQAMYQLGQLARSGWGMEQNLVDAYVWLNLASARGDSRADGARSELLQLLTKAQLNTAQERSRELDQAVP